MNVDELAVERLLAVLRVVRLTELAARREELAGADGEAARLDAAEDLAREPPPHGVRLDQDECALDGHRRGTVTIRRDAVGEDSNCGSETAVGSTGVSQNGQTCHSASSGGLQFVHACFSFVVQIGQTRYDESTSERQTGQCRSRFESRSSIALISSSRSRTSSRYSGGRKSM